MHTVSLLLGAACAALLAFPADQDPPPVPPREAVGRPARHPLEGVYELRRRTIDGKESGAPSRGFLAITQRHLFLQLAAPGPNADLPLVRASARTWKPAADHVAMTVQLGWFTDADGGVHAEKPGSEEKRRIELVQGGVRVVENDRNWLEFERVE